MTNHVLYEPSDFTAEEIQRRNSLAIMVVEGGLGICSRCGASEAELEESPSCHAYRLGLTKGGQYRYTKQPLSPVYEITHFNEEGTIAYARVTTSSEINAAFRQGMWTDLTPWDNLDF